jgi:hypothetical protein
MEDKRVRKTRECRLQGTTPERSQARLGELPVLNLKTSRASLYTEQMTEHWRQPDAATNVHCFQQ